jgi:hypothetical protein
LERISATSAAGDVLPVDGRKYLVLPQNELLQKRDFHAGGVGLHLGLKRGQRKANVDVDGIAGQRDNREADSQLQVARIDRRLHDVVPVEVQASLSIHNGHP